MSEKRLETKQRTTEEAPTGPLPCAEDELVGHLQAFATSFIVANRRDRWMPEHLRKVGNGREQMPKFHRHCDTRYCTWLEGQESFPARLVQRLGGNRTGVYFDENARCCKLTVEDAMEKAMWEGDAIFSILPGELALFFPHDGGGVWLCQRVAKTTNINV